MPTGLDYEPARPRHKLTEGDVWALALKALVVYLAVSAVTLGELVAGSGGFVVEASRHTG
jgi:hypothetical protein